MKSQRNRNSESKKYIFTYIQELASSEHLWALKGCNASKNRIESSRT